MKKRLIYSIFSVTVLMCIATPALSGAISYSLSTRTETQPQSVGQITNTADQRVPVIAFPRKCSIGGSVTFIVLFPMSFVDGTMHYEFKDRTYSDGRNIVSHVFSKAGTFMVEVTFHTKNGKSAAGSANVVVS